MLGHAICLCRMNISIVPSIEGIRRAVLVGMVNPRSPIVFRLRLVRIEFVLRRILREGWNANTWPKRFASRDICCRDKRRV